jgi:CheY-like chemotaxis protein
MVAVELVRGSRSKEVRVGAGRVQIEHREQILTVTDAGALLGIREPLPPADGQPLLVIQAQGQRTVVAIDEVLGHQDLTIRALPQEIRSLPAYQGAAMLARGELLLVLRPDWLVDRDQRAQEPIQARRALVVDDSLTARAIHRSMLESGGFTVHTASTAQQALEQLRHASYDVVVCDVEMPDMDGVALTSAVRGHPETRALPVILVSAYDSDADRSRGLAAGADEFMGKKECAAGRLLTAVSAVMARRQRTPAS